MMHYRLFTVILSALVLVSVARSEIIVSASGTRFVLPENIDRFDIVISHEYLGVAFHVESLESHSILPRSGQCVELSTYLADLLLLPSALINLCHAAPIPRSGLSGDMSITSVSFPSWQNVVSDITKFSHFYTKSFMKCDEGEERCLHSSLDGKSVPTATFAALYKRFRSLERDNRLPFKGRMIILDEDIGDTSSFGIVRSLSRSLVQNGLHAVLHSSIVLDSPLLDCDLMIAERLDNNVYVDSYELSEIERMEGSKVKLIQDIDVEKPADFGSQNFVFCVKENVPFGEEIEIQLPVHFRYQTPSTESFNDVFIPMPQIYARCHSERTRGRPVGWSRMSIEAHHGEDDGNVVVVKVPVGRLQEEVFVKPFTIVSTLFGSILVLGVMLWMYLRSSRGKNGVKSD